jgi:hypothetical protein
MAAAAQSPEEIAVGFEALPAPDKAQNIEGAPRTRSIFVFGTLRDDSPV